MKQMNKTECMYADLSAYGVLDEMDKIQKENGAKGYWIFNEQ